MIGREETVVNYVEVKTFIRILYLTWWFTILGLKLLAILSVHLTSFSTAKDHQLKR